MDSSFDIGKWLPSLDKNNPKFPIALAIFIIYIFYLPPIDLLDRIFSTGNKCLDPLSILPIAFSTYLILRYVFSENWRLKLLLNVSFFIICLLCTGGPYYCFFKSGISVTTSSHEQKVEKSSCNCFGHDKKRAQKIRAIPPVVKQYYTLLQFNLLHVEWNGTSADSVPYYVKIYMKPDSLDLNPALDNYFFSIEAIKQVGSWSDGMFYWISSRYAMCREMLGSDPAKLQPYLDSIPAPLVSGVSNLIATKGFPANTNVTDRLLKFLDTSPTTDALNQELDRFRQPVSYPVTPTPQRDTNLERLLAAQNTMLDQLQKENSRLRAMNNAEKEIFLNAELSKYRGLTSLLRDEINTLKEELVDCKAASNKIEEKRDRTSLQFINKPTITYKFKGKNVLIRNNEKISKKKMGTLTISFGFDIVERLTTAQTLVITQTQGPDEKSKTIYSKPLSCAAGVGGCPVEIDSGILEKGVVKIVLKSKYDGDWQIAVFEVE